MKPEELFGQTQENPIPVVSFEEVEAAFKTPTQHQADYEPQPEPEAPTGDLSDLADPMGDAFHDFEQLPDEPERDPVSPEKAQRTGMRIARLVDTGIDFTLSNLVAKNGQSYKAGERDLQDIAECWGEMAQDKGWNLGPEWTLAILYIMVYGPLVKQAFYDRRMAEIEARQDSMQAQINAMQMQQSAQQQPQPQTQQDLEIPVQDGPTNNATPIGFKPS